MEFEKQRRSMVENQLIRRGISNKLVLGAMSKVPRHRFVRKDMETSAYDDCAMPIGEGQTISQPYMVAIMTEKLGLSGGEKILEIGTGSGYQAAVLAEIAGEVFTVERVPSLAERSGKLLQELGYKNITVIKSDGTEGFKEKAPFDGIIVTAGAPNIPKTLTDQLAEGGKLVIPVGDVFQQMLMVATKKNGIIETEGSIGCVFVSLIGKYGWKK
ncbi:protein-L-isoaspartate(D-aspartate) O-methyltransferase [Candidatus Margulisiibacteriota bacterium]